MKVHVQQRQQGFSLIEVLIYAGLTGIIVALLGGILITSLRIQGQQNSSIDVTKELTFLMGSIKRSIYTAHDLQVMDEGKRLRLLLPEGAERLIFLDIPTETVIQAEMPSGGEGATAGRISSTQVKIKDLTFTELRNGSSSAVQIFITAAASTTDEARLARRSVQSTAAVMVQEQ